MLDTATGRTIAMATFRSVSEFSGEPRPSAFKHRVPKAGPAVLAGLETHVLSDQGSGGFGAIRPQEARQRASCLWSSECVAQKPGSWCGGIEQHDAGDDLT